MKKYALLILSTLSLGASGELYDFNLGLGLMNEAVGRYQTDVNGDKSLFNNKLALEAEGSYHLTEEKQWNLHGNFGLLWPGGEESYITRNVFYLTSTVGYMIHGELEVRLGGSLYFTRISGDGGAVPIQNGSTTTDFPIPKEASVARNITLNMLINYEFYDDFSVRGEAFIFNPANSRNRTFNLALTLRYHFGDSLWQND